MNQQKYISLIIGITKLQCDLKIKTGELIDTCRDISKNIGFYTSLGTTAHRAPCEDPEKIIEQLKRLIVEEILDSATEYKKDE